MSQTPLLSLSTAALVSLAELHRILPEPGSPKVDISLAIVLSALIGSVSFAGSGVAFAKLQELIGGRPITYPGQQWVNAAVFLGCLAAGIALVAGVQHEWLLWALVGGAVEDAAARQRHRTAILPH